VNRKALFPKEKMSEQILNRPPQFDKEMVEIVDYVLHYRSRTRLLGPLTGGTTCRTARAPGPADELAPVTCPGAGRFNSAAIAAAPHRFPLPIDNFKGQSGAFFFANPTRTNPDRFTPSKCAGSNAGVSI